MPRAKKIIADTPRIAGLKRVREIMPVTQAEVVEYVKTILGVDLCLIPNDLCAEEFGHCGPNLFPVEIFLDSQKGEDAEIPRTVGVHGSRGSSKTWDDALSMFLHAKFFPDSEQRTVASKTQAKNCFRHVSRMLQLVHLKDLCTIRNQEGTELTNGSLITILAKTADAVSGSRPHIGYADEVDEWDREVLGRFIGMPQTRGGLPARAVFSSSTYYHDGPMADMLKRFKPRKNAKIYVTCMWDAMQSCKEAFGGCKCKTAHGWQADNCPISKICQGRAEHSHGFIKWADVIMKYEELKSNPGQWEGEYLCRSARIDALKYGGFIPEEWPAGNLASYRYDPSLPLYLAVDPGITDPYCVLFAQVWNGRVYVFDMIYQKGLTTIDVKKLVEKRDYKLSDKVFMDAQRAQDLRLWATEVEGTKKYPASMPFPKGMGAKYNRIEYGEQLLTWAICDGEKRRRLCLHPTACAAAIKEIMSQKFRVESSGEVDTSKITGKKVHALDSLRYLLVGLEFALRGELKRMQIATADAPDAPRQLENEEEADPVFTIMRSILAKWGIDENDAPEETKNVALALAEASVFGRAQRRASGLYTPIG